MKTFVAIAATAAIVHALHTSYRRYAIGTLTTTAIENMNYVRAVGYVQGRIEQRMEDGSYVPETPEQIETDIKIGIIEYLESR